MWKLVRLQSLKFEFAFYKRLVISIVKHTSGFKVILVSSQVYLLSGVAGSCLVQNFADVDLDRHDFSNLPPCVEATVVACSWQAVVYGLITIVGHHLRLGC